jgi:hypothetical protein
MSRGKRFESARRLSFFFRFAGKTRGMKIWLIRWALVSGIILVHKVNPLGGSKVNARGGADHDNTRGEDTYGAAFVAE